MVPVAVARFWWVGDGEGGRGGGEVVEVGDRRLGAGGRLKVGDAVCFFNY